MPTATRRRSKKRTPIWERNCSRKYEFRDLPGIPSSPRAVSLLPANRIRAFPDQQWRARVDGAAGKRSVGGVAIPGQGIQEDLVSNRQRHLPVCQRRPAERLAPSRRNLFRAAVGHVQPTAYQDGPPQIPGNWDPEPAGWTRLAAILANATRSSWISTPWSWARAICPPTNSRI